MNAICWFPNLEQSTTRASGSGLDFRPFQTKTYTTHLLTGVMKSYRLMTIDFWRYKNSVYVCVYYTYVVHDTVLVSVSL